MEIFVTIPPDAPFIMDASRIPSIKGFRFNTGWPVTGDKLQALKAFKARVWPKEPWIDLKSRELRLLDATEITPANRVLKINHHVKAPVPAPLYYNEGKNHVQVERITNGNELHVYLPSTIKQDFKISFGKNASFNMPDAQVTDSPLTTNDKDFIIACLEANIHQYCLSFVESEADISAIVDLDPGAEVIAKIESTRGLDFVRNDYSRVKDRVRLMAARGDLYIELDRPHEILEAVKIIISADPNAIGASRLFETVLEPGEVPSCADISDAALLLKMGYKTFLLGDFVCEREDTLKPAIGLLNAIEESYKNGLF